MNLEEQESLKKEFQLRDRVVRVLSEDGYFRAVAVKNTTTAKTAQTNHLLDRITSFLLARALSAATMMSSFLKGEERIILEFEGAGPVRKVYAESMQVGESRGYVILAADAENTPINEIGDALGAGILRVSRILFNQAEPNTSLVPLAKGDIATDLAEYFAQSEQIPTAVILDVDYNEDGTIAQSGGLMLQAMPGHTEAQLHEVYNELIKIKTIAGLYSQDYNPRDVLKKVLPFNFKVISSSQVDFFCRCSKDGFMNKLLTLGLKELQSMKEHNNNELVCQYCNAKYLLEPADFDRLIEESKAKIN